jgi:two-component system, sensor histidine kinase and response regulator
MAPRVTCLLVDDLEENLLALSALLRRDDVRILTARSGREALELLLVHEVALAFVDVQMPEMDGFELAELMRGSERTRSIPLIFVTAENREPSRAFKGYNTGAVDFLYKPIDPLVLESKAAVFFELHRQKQLLAEELRQRSETLRLQEMFTAVLGHDLRNPLNAILTAAFLLDKRSDDEAVRDTARRILTSGKRMTRMIENMLDLTRARLAGGIPLNRSHADLAAVVERVVQELRTTHPSRRIETVILGEVTGEWDVDRLQQIASNLIGNAIQHGDPNGAVFVRVDGTASETVSLSVVNDGVIPRETLPTIFDPFRSGPRGQSEGLGLGLYIAQQIAIAHHGRILVESSPDAGTVFTVTMPRRVAEVVRL